MIHLYAAPTSNNHKVRIALEELGLPYEVTPVDLEAGEQREPWYVKLCPNARTPVMRDGERTIWESGAILLYLADQYDPEERILSSQPAARWQAIELAFFQAAGLGPNLGRLADQLRKPAEARNAEMVETFAAEVDRILGVLDLLLVDGRPFLARDYSIADIMHYPWLQPVLALRAPQLLGRQRVVDWLARIEARPAVRSVYAS